MMVYERIPVTTHHYDFPPNLGPFLPVIIVYYRLSISILGTCRFIRKECEPVLQKRLRDLRSKGVRYIIDANTCSDNYHRRKHMLG